MIRQLNVSLFLILLVSLFSACSMEKPSSEVTVISMEKEVDKSKPGVETCDSFNMTRNDVVNYFSTAQPADDFEFYSKEKIMACKYRGTVTIKGDRLNWIIMAGGAAYLYKDETVKSRYLCTEKCCDVIPGLCEVPDEI
jgi:hypothetical protein